MTTWKFAIDWDRNNNFSDTLDNVSDRVISAQWVIGMQQPYQDIADNTILKLVLDNSDKRFSPENTSSVLAGKLLPFCSVRVQSDDGGAIRTHWIGWIDQIQPMPGKYRGRQVEIIATGPMHLLKSAEVSLPLQENKRTDEVIAALIKEVVIPPAQFNGWVLDVGGHSRLQTSTYLGTPDLYSALDVGKLTFALAGDNWVINGGASDALKNTFDVYRALSDIAAAERGKFLFNREGKAVFWNRHFLLQGTTPQVTLTDTMTDMVYAFAGIDDIRNEVIVTAHPRQVSNVATDVLWQLGNAVIEVDAGKTREVSIKYEDVDGKRIGGRDVTASDLEYDGTNLTLLVEPKANGASLKFSNQGTGKATVTKLILKGRRISDSGQIEVKAIDSGSRRDYGRRTLRLNLPSIDSVTQAQYIADFERDRRATPYGVVKSLSLVSHATLGGEQHGQQLSRTIGDTIAVIETQSAHGNAQAYSQFANTYVIVGEIHEIKHSGTLWLTKWVLEPVPAPNKLPWRLGASGRHTLDVSTRLTI